MHSHKTLSCTADGRGRACIWPGRLTVKVDDNAGRFALEVYTDRPGWVRLPGSAKRWPQEVFAGTERAFVGKDGAGRPQVQLMAGLHKVTGRWAWSAPPEVLTVPKDLALSSIVRGGKRVVRVRRDGERLWLRQGAGPRDAVADSLRVRVQRRIDDGVPQRVTTRLLLQVAGSSRDVDFGRILLAGTVPSAVKDGGLPVQVTAGGRVRAHVRPGRHQIEVSAVLPTDAKVLSLPPHATESGIEDTETWVFFPDVQVRTVEVSGGSGVDPERTRLAKDWRGGSTFVLGTGQALKLTTTRRGETEAPPNRLRVRRQIWLDGDGLTIKDRLTGEMHRNWRVDFSGAGVLGRVHDKRAKRDLLITRRPGSQRANGDKDDGKGGKGDHGKGDGGAAGVELRQGKVDLEAVSRLPQIPIAMKAIGWDADVQSLSATLHLPPGWSLLSATGVDHVPNTWLSSWTLFDFFLVLMVALGTARLVGWKWGVVALFGLALSHGESGAPEWVWLNLLGSLALVRALPDGWFRRGAQLWRGLAMVSLVLILVPFSVLQVRHGIYPQVSRPSHSGGWTDMNLPGAMNADMAKMEQAATSAPEPQRASRSLLRRKGKSKRYWKGNKKALQQLSQIDPKAVVQTGPGLPDWTWTKWPLRWSGPVAKGHKLELILLSPTTNLLLALLRVALLIAMGLALLELPKLRTGMRRWMSADKATGSALLALLLVPAMAPGSASARVPNPKVLVKKAANTAPKQQQARQQSNIPPPVAPVADESGEGGAGVPPKWALAALERRLVKAAQCPTGGCLVTPTAAIAIRDRKVSLTAEVHALRDAAWTLPGGMIISQVRIDGQPTWQLRRKDGLQVRVPAGRRTIEVTGQLPPGRVVTLLFSAASRPAFLQMDAPGWRVDGLGKSGVPEGSVQLTHQGGGPAQAEALQTELPAWYHVDRQLLLGLPWRVQTTLSRPRTVRAGLVRLPLLPGEAVITAGIRVEKNKAGVREAIVHLPRGTREIQLESELPTTTAIALKAPTGRPWTETWTLVCSPIWRCSHTGLPPVQRQAADGSLAPRWQPWPGESVAIAIARPMGTSGQTTTVDRVDLVVKPGTRLLEGTLRLKMRASQGGTRNITLPADAELQTVTIDGKERSLRATKGDNGQVVTVPVHPGAQRTSLKWQQPWSRALKETVPAVDVGGPAANVRITMKTGDDRWLLWAFGPRWGPAVLFWSHLFVLFLLAIGLGKIPNLPVKTGHWLLLSLGFAQLPAPVLLPIVLFFVAFSWRQSFWRARPAPAHVALFDLSQIALVGIALFFLVALYAAIHSNLLMDIDMQVRGMGSRNGHLVWYQARTGGALPSPAMLSLPLLVWRVAMLLWSLWLVSALIRWLQWAWRCYADGGLWRKEPRRQVPQMTPEAGGIPAPPPGTATLPEQ